MPSFNAKHHRVLGDWRLFNWLIFSQMLFVIVVPIFMPESCRWAKGPVIRLRVSFEWYSYRHRWLMSRGEGNRSVTIMKRIAKMNKKEVFCHYLQFQSLRWWFWLLGLRPSCLQHSDLVTHCTNSPTKLARGINSAFSWGELRRVLLRLILEFISSACIGEAFIHHQHSTSQRFQTVSTLQLASCVRRIRGRQRGETD